MNPYLENPYADVDDYDYERAWEAIDRNDVLHTLYRRVFDDERYNEFASEDDASNAALNAVLRVIDENEV